MSPFWGVHGQATDVLLLENIDKVNFWIIKEEKKFQRQRNLFGRRLSSLLSVFSRPQQRILSLPAFVCVSFSRGQIRCSSLVSAQDGSLSTKGIVVCE